MGATSATLWSPGATLLSFINNADLEFCYCVPGALSTANIVATTSGTTGDNLFVWRVSGTTSTPLDVVSPASATSTTIDLNDIETKVGGAVIALGVTQLASVTFTESWTGSEAVVEDFDDNSATNNSQLVACHFATTAATTTNDLQLTISASQIHIGGAISFGP